MTEIKLTEWFPGFVKPVRPGWYRTKFVVGTLKSGEGYSYWSGKQWSNQRADHGGVRTYDGASQYKIWRGIDRS